MLPVNSSAGPKSPVVKMLSVSLSVSETVKNFETMSGIFPDQASNFRLTEASMASAQFPVFAGVAGMIISSLSYIRLFRGVGDAVADDEVAIELRRQSGRAQAREIVMRERVQSFPGTGVVLDPVL